MLECIRNLYLIKFGPKKGRFGRDLLRGGVLGDGLGSFRHSVLGQLTREQEPHSGLNFPGGDGGPLVVVGQTGRFSGDSLENVVHERIHDGHSLGGHTGVRVDLLEDLVNVDGVALLPLLLALLVSLRNRLLRLASLFRSFR